MIVLSEKILDVIKNLDKRDRIKLGKIMNMMEDRGIGIEDFMPDKVAPAELLIEEQILVKDLEQAASDNGYECIEEFILGEKSENESMGEFVSEYIDGWFSMEREKIM